MFSNYAISLLFFALLFSQFGISQSVFLDPSFGDNGVTIDTIGTYADEINSILIQPDDKIIAAGYSRTGFVNSDFALVRYNTDGTRDVSFGTNGEVITSIQPKSRGNSLSLQDDNKILLVGSSSQAINLVRYNSNGSLDTSFGNNGIVITEMVNFYDQSCKSISLQQDGKIIVGGSAVSNGPDIPHHFVFRYLPNGDLDSSFATNGIAMENYEYGKAVTIQQDGKILIAGIKNLEFHVSRYTVDGILDNTFGVGGKVSVDMLTIGTSEANIVRVQTDGKIVLGGRSSVLVGGFPKNKFCLARLESNGDLDMTFGTNGRVVSDVSSNYSSEINALILDPSGKILSIGRNVGDSTVGYILMRYLADGSVDNSFGINGTIVSPYSFSSGNSVDVQSDEKIVVGGHFYSDSITNYNFAVARFNPAQVSLDESACNGCPVNGFDIYPNPWGTSTKLRFKHPIIEGRIVLKDFYGKPVRTIHNVNGSELMLERSNLPSGVYFVSLIDSNGTHEVTERVVIL